MGVPITITTVSASRMAPALVVARMRPSGNASWSTASAPGSSNGSRPPLTAATAAASRS